MLTRLHVTNFRCLEDFEFRPSSFNVLAGNNGSGKSTFLELLHILRDFISGTPVDKVFLPSSKTRWSHSDLQTIAIDIDDEIGKFRYELAIRYYIEPDRAYVEKETLSLDGTVILEATENGTTVREESGEERFVLWRADQASAVSMVPNKKSMNRIRRFRDLWISAILVSINPRTITAYSTAEAFRLAADGSNFVDWYRTTIQSSMQRTTRLQQSLLDSIGAASADLDIVGDAKRLMLAFDNQDDALVRYRLDELSDGQRALVVLYSILEVIRDGRYLVVLDEPDNYVAASEIGPWLSRAMAASDDKRSQVFLFTHNPYVIDFEGGIYCHRFEREANGPARVAPCGGLAADDLPLSSVLLLESA